MIPTTTIVLADSLSSSTIRRDVVLDDPREVVLDGEVDGSPQTLRYVPGRLDGVGAMYITISEQAAGTLWRMRD